MVTLLIGEVVDEEFGSSSRDIWTGCDTRAGQYSEIFDDCFIGMYSQTQ
jgi:hypothetical protein